MKWRQAIFIIGVGALAFGPLPTSAAESSMPTRRSVTIKSGDLSQYRHPDAGRYPAWELYEAPRACSAVKFPRSPLCASVPARFSPYGIAYPWVSF